MKKLGTVGFSGSSGARYAFAAYPLESVFDKGFHGVYVVTQRREGESKTGFVHRKMGVGQSDGLCQPLVRGAQCFAARGANCICVHVEKDRDARLNVVHDLMRKRGPDAHA